MKKYYFTLSKEKKDEIKLIYQKEYKNSDINIRLKRLSLYVIVGFIFSILLFIDTFKDNDLNVGSLVIAITLALACFVFLIGKYIVKLRILNKIALKNK